MALGALIVGAVAPILDKILGFIPNKNDRAKAKEQFESQILIAMTGLVEGQLAINKEEAKHPSIFVAGWRPAIGWVCAVALFWNFICQPLLTWGVFFWPEYSDQIGKVPKLESDELMTVLLGMLGLGGLRTYEKRLGTARENMKGTSLLGK